MPFGSLAHHGRQAENLTNQHAGCRASAAPPDFSDYFCFFEDRSGASERVPSDVFHIASDAASGRVRAV